VVLEGEAGKAIATRSGTVEKRTRLSEMQKSYHQLEGVDTYRIALRKLALFHSPTDERD
jgi:hypothetical protein